MHLLSLNTEPWQKRELAALLTEKGCIKINTAKAEKISNEFQIFMVVKPKYYSNCPNSEQTHITVIHKWTALLIPTGK